MEDKFISTSEAAKILGISRVAVFKQIKAGKLKAERVGRNFVIDKVLLIGSIEKPSQKRIEEIDRVVDKVLKEYGEVIKKLGKE